MIIQLKKISQPPASIINVVGAFLEPSERSYASEFDKQMDNTQTLRFQQVTHCLL